ncbi:MAG: hypothetical protein JWN88_1058, partial [Frankiales bacterium]|nr:hypothetical protein [Frankiales bacterium]
FRAASAVRGERAIHAKGKTFTGTVDIPGGAGVGLALFDEPQRYDAVIRFSRAVGLPDLVPDFLGLALRLLDAGGPGEHQDLVMDTGAAPPVLRNLPLPARNLMGSTYSTLLPFGAEGRRLLVGAQPWAGPRVTSLERLVDVLPVRLRLVVAFQTGPWRPVGEVVCRAEMPAPVGRQVRFSPYQDGGDLVPVGRINAWRKGAYEASHVGRDA